ncbi:uncharacterized protein LOC117930478 [Vitis riparia]|uniref:uncharacterized protein LOC117930478 n=1 Tax=Vitis riparia TaxID=96939 RepID=UPI00155A0ABD|nr:uncharacterized protein LOC117930478 [Vitis riparia]
MALGCMLAQFDDLGKEQAIYYLSKRMLEYEYRYIMIECLCLALVWAIKRPRHYVTEYPIHLVSRLDPLKYLFNMPILTGRLMRWLVLLTKFDIQYVTQKSVKGSIVADHLTSLLVSDDRSIDDNFPGEHFVLVASIVGWRLYFDGTTNQSGFGIGILLISPQGDHIPKSVRLAFSYHHRLTNKVVNYEACITGLETALDLGVRQVENQFADALATLASMIEIPTRMIMRPLLIKTRSAPAYCCLIGNIKDRAELPWRSSNGMLLLCINRATTDRVMREVHAGVCRPHIGSHMLARKIMRTGYFWLTMEIDCCQFVQRCPKCQMHEDLIHVPPSELHALTSTWPFSMWGVDVIEKVSLKSSNGHEYILVAIDYFTKWVEASSYAILIAAKVAKFIRSHIICRYKITHELISDRGVHFRGEVDTLV